MSFSLPSTLGSCPSVPGCVGRSGWFGPTPTRGLTPGSGVGVWVGGSVRGSPAQGGLRWQAPEPLCNLGPRTARVLPRDGARACGAQANGPVEAAGRKFSKDAASHKVCPCSGESVRAPLRHVGQRCADQTPRVIPNAMARG
eukprot:9227142-Lingulodinium_polyedra.AAC.1